MSEILAWHFVDDKLRNGRPVPPVGTPLYFYGNPKLCYRGLHASLKLIDALQYAPGDTLCRVKCGGSFIFGNDKLVCTERTILWKKDITSILATFARTCALETIEWWNMPEIIKRFLQTGDQALFDMAYNKFKDIIHSWEYEKLRATDSTMNNALETVYRALNIYCKGSQVAYNGAIAISAIIHAHLWASYNPFDPKQPSQATTLYNTYNSKLKKMVFSQ